MAFASLKIFTEKLRQAISRAGYNYAELARELGVSPQSMNTYTSKKTKIAAMKPATARRMAVLLEVSLDELRVPDEQPPAETNGESLKIPGVFPGNELGTTKQAASMSEAARKKVEKKKGGQS